MSHPRHTYLWDTRTQYIYIYIAIIYIYITTIYNYPHINMYTDRCHTKPTHCRPCLPRWLLCRSSTFCLEGKQPGHIDCCKNWIQCLSNFAGFHTAPALNLALTCPTSLEPPEWKTDLFNWMASARTVLALNTAFNIVKSIMSKECRAAEEWDVAKDSWLHVVLQT